MLKITPEAEVTSSKKDPLSGVGGWLKFLCIYLLVISPLFGLIGLIIEFSSISKIPWFYWTIINLRIPIIMGIVFSIGFIPFSIYAGYALFSRTDKRAVTIARVFLLALLICKVIVLTTVLYFSASREVVTTSGQSLMSEMVTAAVINFVVSLVVIVAGNLYLSASRRVEQTYVD